MATEQEEYQEYLEYLDYLDSLEPEQYLTFGGKEGDVPMFTTTPPAPAPKASFSPLGVGEAALTALTGATGGLAGQAFGGLEEAGRQVLAGQFGTPEAADAIEQAALDQASEFTYQPRTAAGQRYLQALEPVVGALPPILGVTNPGTVVPGARSSVASARAGQEMLSEALVPNYRPPIAPPPTPPAPRPIPGVVPTASLADSAGARRTPTETYRQIMAENFPIPFRDESAPTAGQLTRDLDQLKWEIETAKTAPGRRIAQRLENQQGTIRANLGALAEQFDPLEVEPIGIGTGVNRALQQRRDRLKSRVNRAYTRAREAGDMEEPTVVDGLPAVFAELVPIEGQVPLARSIRNEAQRLGLIDDQGQLVPQPINQIEELRKFVNKWTDYRDGGQVRIAQMVNTAIDDAMRDRGGPAYQVARGLARRQFEEFKDTKIVADIMGRKGDTSERRIALEDVADRIVVRAPLEEMIKARNIMRRAGPDGDQAWRDLQAYGIEYILNRASGKQVGVDGQPLIVPSQFIKVIEQFDRSNKLEVLYGPKRAQTLRDLAELSRLLLSAPPAAGVNYSNTASALRSVLQDMAMSGGDATTATARQILRGIRDVMQDRKIKRQVDKALRGEMRDQ